MTVLMNHLVDSVKDISLILLIIAGAGAMKQILTETGMQQIPTYGQLQNAAQKNK